MRKTLLLLALLLGAAPAIASTPLNVVAACNAPGSIVVSLTNGPSATVEVAGTYVASIAFSTATSSTFIPAPGWPIGGTAGPASSTSANGQWTILSGGAQFLCVTLTSYTSGLANVTIVVNPTVTPAAAAPGAPVQGLSTTAAFGSVSSAGAGAVIATLTPGAGTYEITVMANVAGTLTSADIDNMQVKIGGSVVTTLIVSAAANIAPNPVTFRRLVVPSATSVSVNTIGAATGSSIYRASLLLTPVN